MLGIETSPRRPSQDIPPLTHGFLSLWDMLRFYADRLFRAIESLRTVEAVAGNDAASVYGNEKSRKHVSDQLETLISEAKTLGLTVAAKKASALKFSIEHKIGGDNHDNVAAWVTRHLQTIREIIQYELEEKALFVVLSHVDYLAEDVSAKPLFGQAVAWMFPAAAFDIAEAGKCLALRRYTACVFHLMRVVEIGIRSIGKDLQIEVSPSAGWLKIINDELEPAIEKLPQKTEQERKRRRELQQTRAHLHAIRVGWRNDTMHPKDTYTEDEAESLFNHVRTFMSHLADQMDAPSGPEQRA